MISKNQTKYIRSLGFKKFRYKYNSFIAEGAKTVHEILQSSLSVDSIYSLTSWEVKNSYQNALNSAQHELVSPEEMKQISQLSSPSEVLAVVQMPKTQFQAENHLKGRVLALDSIQDPGNLGTIIRSADWFGIKTIICSKKCADRFHPKVIQSTMGSIAHLNVFEADLTVLFEEHSKLPAYGATLNGEDLRSVDFAEDCFILIGNESKGISMDLLPFLTKEIKIEGRGKAESLNAAIATSIILYATLKA